MMIDVHIRWMFRRDMEEVLEIEKQSFERPWFEDDFKRMLRQRNCIGMVADMEPPESRQSCVVGFMIYELHKTRLHIVNFAVHPGFRRLGVGTAMSRKLIGKLSPQRRKRILVEVRETNLDAHLFFRQSGFRAISVLRDFWDDEDAYQFAYMVRARETVA